MARDHYCEGFQAEWSLLWGLSSRSFHKMIENQFNAKSEYEGVERGENI